MANTSYTFPFGRSVRPCKPSASDRRPVFILGAYPSALHVEWVPPKGYSRIKAIAVDNEPEPFWSGDGQEKLIADWRRAVKFDPATMGEVKPAGDLNGSSGAWVDENILGPLGAARADTWITDALDTYRCSPALAARLDDTYNRFAARVGLPQARLPDHPDEKQIVDEACDKHRPRLNAEFEAASLTRS